jgi:hypothetical protein
MTENWLERENTRLRDRVRIVVGLESVTLVNFIKALVLALPFAFLAATGPLFVVGVLYALAYVVAMLLPTAVYVLMAFDAIRVLTGRGAVFVPVLIAVGRKGGTRKDAYQKKTLVEQIIQLTVTGNPLASLTRELWFVAFRFNRDAIKRIEDSADTISKNMSGTGITGRFVAAELRTVPTEEAGIELVMC